MNKKMNGKAWKIAGMVVGALTVAAGIIVMATYNGMTPMISVSGNDFYSYLYQASAYGAYNILMLERTVSFGFGFVLMSIGLAEICYFGMKLYGRRSKPDSFVKKEETVPAAVQELKDAGNPELTGPVDESEAESSMPYYAEGDMESETSSSADVETAVQQMEEIDREIRKAEEAIASANADQDEAVSSAVD